MARDPLGTAPASLFICGVMFSAWSGGVGPGLLATALSVLTFKYYFVPSIYSLAVGGGEIPRLIIFTLSALFAVSLSAAQRRAVGSLSHARDQLRALAARLQSIREEERKRVAREIHDELGQALTAIKIDLSSLVYELPADQKQQSSRTASVLELVDGMIQSVRRISTQLRPGILDDLGLVAAVEWAVEEFEARTGTRCRLDLPRGDIGTDPERATALFRILQETLTNVARHAGATQLEVRLAREHGNLLLEVRDNGKGISEEQISGGRSLGILGMWERASLLGGEIAIRGLPRKRHHCECANSRCPSHGHRPRQVIRVLIVDWK
jgi:signal transduction histidine kinase